MLHVVLHFIVPLFVALALYRSRWRNATLILIGTMLVDIDHLLASPIYDPERCSIGFHPLHTIPFIVVYAALFLGPLLKRNDQKSWDTSLKRVIHLIGLGLLIHMVLDWIDCLV